MLTDAKGSLRQNDRDKEQKQFLELPRAEAQLLKITVMNELTQRMVPRELLVWQGASELRIFNLNSWMVYTGTSLPAPKQLCALAHLGSTREAGTFYFISKRNLGTLIG
jgi:hypothetical protein